MRRAERVVTALSRICYSARTGHRVVAVPSSSRAGSSAPRPRPSRSPSPGTRVPPATGARPPALLLAVVVLLWIEALGAAAAAVALVVVVLRGTQLAAASITLAVLAAGLGVVLWFAGRALLRGRRWARSPVITVHILVAAMSVASWRTAPAPWPALALVVGVCAVACLLLPPVVAWTAGATAPGATGSGRAGTRR